MKKHLFILLGLFYTNLVFGQIQLTESETKIFKEICDQSIVPLKESSLMNLKKNTSVRFLGFIEQMIVSKSNTEEILESKYLKRPTHEELVFWYVIRELNYNNSAPDSLKKSQDIIIQEVFKDIIDERWLLDNFYYRISGPLKLLFNDADLSNHNFQIEELGFKNETEKAIFFFFLINSCGQRLSVMNYTGKGDMKSVIERFPKINGKEYYYFKNFDYPDFDWIGYKKIESYNLRHFAVYYEILLIHFTNLIQDNQEKEARNFFNNSILSNPKLFKYSDFEDTLIENYDKWK